MNSLWRFVTGMFGKHGVKTKATPSSSQPPNHATDPASVEKHEFPYGIASRPAPKGDDLDELLPSAVGPYTREPIETPDSPESSIYANYTRGRSTVFVELGICGDPEKAQKALGRAKAETGAEFPDRPQLFVKWQDDLCLKTVDRHGAFVAWTRGSYYFSAHALGGEMDLEAFITAFPY